jgi:GTPase SAR1 family protein
VADLPFPLSGVTLVTGPSNVGKTRLTARALEQWVVDEGPHGAVVLDFAPVVERDETVLGGRLTQFADVPDTVWHGVLAAHAPRTDGADEAESRRLAADNARRAERLFAAAPADPTAVFVNDATIPFQHVDGDPQRLTDYCDGATTVINAFDGDELGATDYVSRRERTALSRLRDRVDRECRLDSTGDCATKRS